MSIFYSIRGGSLEKQIILLVDDEPVILDSAAEYLSQEFNVHKASNGVEAWEILNKEKIDCLVTDIKMPIMNGFELLEKINASDISIKTIVVSGVIQPWCLVKFQDLGLDAYCAKPYDIRKLKEMIKSTLNE